MATLKGLVLDLDGTLVESLPDLLAVLNQVLGDFGVPEVTPAEAKPMVGDGTAKLVERALAARAVTPDRIPPAVSRFLTLYEARPARLSRPYPGVPEALAELAGAGWHFALACRRKSPTQRPCGQRSLPSRCRPIAPSPSAITRMTFAPPGARDSVRSSCAMATAR